MLAKLETTLDECPATSSRYARAQDSDRGKPSPLQAWPGAQRWRAEDCVAILSGKRSLNLDTDGKANLLRLQRLLKPHQSRNTATHTVRLASPTPDKESPVAASTQAKVATGFTTLQVERDTHNTQESGTVGWRVHLRLELDVVGTVETQLALTGGELSAALRAERVATGRLVSNHLDTLSESLATAGLTRKTVTSTRGGPSPWAHHRHSSRLLEIRA